MAALRGLIYVVVYRYPSLLSKLRVEWDKKGKKLFNNSNTSGLLGNVLTAMLQDPLLHDAVFIVDALDECREGRSSLTKLIANLSNTCRAKWIVSSHDWPEIDRELKVVRGLIPITLEENETDVAEAVQAYIKIRVDELAADRWDNDEELKKDVKDHMVAKADDTFLWVALVCQRLAEAEVPKRLVRNELYQLPKGLIDLYKLMMDRILASSETDRLKAVLTTACMACRSLTSMEMVALVKQMEGYSESDVKDTIGSCSSFLIYQDGVVSFVHESAKKYLVEQCSDEVIPHGAEFQHSKITLRSLEVLGKGLDQDIYRLGTPSATTKGASRQSLDPLAPLEYSCLNWSKHLFESGFEKSRDIGTVEEIWRFFQATFTSWLEALSWLGNLPVAATTIINVELVLGNSEGPPGLVEFLRDAHRFYLSHAQVIATTPLQVYSSALIFSPRHSAVRKQFDYQVPEWITSKPEMQDDWDACIQTFHVSKRRVRAVECSPDGKLLVASCEKEALVFNAASGNCTYTLTFPGAVCSMAFSPCGTWLAVASMKEVSILKVGTYDCIQTLEDGDASAVVFSADGEQLATVSSDEAHVWNWKTNDLVSVLQGHGSYTTSAAFLPGGKLATASDDGTVKIWDPITRNCEQTLEGHGSTVWSVASSPDEKRLATGSKDQTAKIWEQSDTGEWSCVQTLHHKQEVPAVCFSGDGRILITGSIDNGIRLWDEAGVCIKALHGHSMRTTSLSVSSTGQLLASSSADGTVKLWDISSTRAEALDDYVDRIINLAFSPDGEMLISHSDDGETRLWNVRSGSCVPAQEVPEAYKPFFETPTIASAWFSRIRGGELAAMRGTDGKTAIWDMDTGRRTFVLGDTADVARHHKFGDSVLVFSDDAKLLATSSKGESVRVWNTSSRECLLVLPHSHIKQPLAFSPDSRRLFTYEGGKVMMKRLDNGDLASSTGTQRLVTQFGTLQAAVPDKFDSVRFVGWGISLRGDWIMRGEEPMLWIPAEYRQLIVDPLRKRFAIICPSGRIVTMNVA